MGIEATVQTLTVRTTNNEDFSGMESCLLAFLIHKRFGRDPVLTAAKWRGLLQNSASDTAIMDMVREGARIAENRSIGPVLIQGMDRRSALA